MIRAYRWTRSWRQRYYGRILIDAKMHVKREGIGEEAEQMVARH